MDYIYIYICIIYIYVLYIHHISLSFFLYLYVYLQRNISLTNPCVYPRRWCPSEVHRLQLVVNNSNVTCLLVTLLVIPSGKLSKQLWKITIEIVDFAMKHGDLNHIYVKLPEGISRVFMG